MLLGKYLEKVVPFAPVRARGLKPRVPELADQALYVRARTGAWIETNSTLSPPWTCRVRARTGAWVETTRREILTTQNLFAPVRARGLKRVRGQAAGRKCRFAPVRARGLKPSR